MTTQIAPTQNQASVQTPAERFTSAVMSNFATNGGEISLTTHQKKLIQNFFIKIDMILKEAEIKRMAVKEQDREPLQYSWQTVNLQKLAVDVIAYSAVGLDPTQPNQLNPIPFKNKHTNQYDISFILGYKGIEIKAKKYGLMVPDDVVVELVYKNDKFVPIKKSIDNPGDNYSFEIQNPFDRGEIVGGFYYHHYFNNPKMNKLEIFTKADIDKRKPKYASAEFWGGEKDVWKWDNEKKKNVKSGTEEIAGWYDEMAYKTIYRAAYNAITIDSEKIDQHYLEVIKRERETLDTRIEGLIAESANTGEALSFEEVEPQNSTTTPQNTSVQQSEGGDNASMPAQQSISFDAPATTTVNEPVAVQQSAKERGF